MRQCYSWGSVASIVIEIAFLLFISLLLIHIPKKNIEQQQTVIKETKNGKKTPHWRKPTWKLWLYLPGYRKQIELSKVLASEGLPNKILLYGVRKKLIWKVTVGYLWSCLVRIKHDVILKDLRYFLSYFCKTLSERLSQQLPKSTTLSSSELFTEVILIQQNEWKTAI